MPRSKGLCQLHTALVCAIVLVVSILPVLNASADGRWRTFSVPDDPDPQQNLLSTDIRALAADVDERGISQMWVGTDRGLALRRDGRWTTWRRDDGLAHVVPGIPLSTTWLRDEDNSLRDPERSFVLITHYQRLLEHIVPDTVHVLYKGQVVKSGDKSLALTLENEGYAGIVGEAA